MEFEDEIGAYDTRDEVGAFLQGFAQAIGGLHLEVEETRDLGDVIMLVVVAREPLARRVERLDIERVSTVAVGEGELELGHARLPSLHSWSSIASRMTADTERRSCSASCFSSRARSGETHAWTTSPVDVGDSAVATLTRPP